MTPKPEGFVEHCVHGVILGVCLHCANAALRSRLAKLEAVATAARDLVSEDHAFEKTDSHCVTKTAFVAMRAALAALEAP